MEKDLYSNLHGKYPLSKTLRFELKPIGKTKENIEKNNLISNDVHRAESYKRVKKYCDEYHKIFIDKCMNDYQIDLKLLNEYYLLYVKEKRNDDEKKRISEIQNQMRTGISKKFKNNVEYKGLFGKDIIQEYLVELYKNDVEKLGDISEFKRFTTYFSGFNTNRENMYVADEKSTAIAYRLVNENLPFFAHNCKNMKLAKEKLADKIEILHKELGEYVQVNDVLEMFEMSYFNEVLTQRGIEVYNIIIQGKAKEDGTKIKGLNEYINEFNQVQLNKNDRLPKFTQLYKQILSESIGASFVIESIDSDVELVDKIKEFCENICLKINSGVLNAISNLSEFNLEHVYLNNDLSLTQISQDIYGDWNKINEKICEYYDKNYTGKKKQGTSAYLEERKKSLKENKVYSISFLNMALEDNKIEEYIKNYVKSKNLIENIFTNYDECTEDLNMDYEVSSRELIENEKAIGKIKKLLDSIKTLQDFVKILLPKDRNIEKDDFFYNSVETFYDELVQIIPLYNKTRNYLTQKPFSTSKVKLNFENDTFLSGWDLNKEKDNFGVLLMKDNKYYLGILNPYNKKVFEDTECTENVPCYKKMEYKFTKDITLTIPKCSTQLNEVKNHFKHSDEEYILDDPENFSFPINISKEIFDLNNVTYNLDGKEYKKFQIGYLQETQNYDEFNHAVDVWIEFCKNFLRSYKSTAIYDLEDVFSQKYSRVDAFYNACNKKLYSIKFRNYSEEYINYLVEIGDLYLFQIYNKDFSENKKKSGTPNLHTIYWKALFDDKNLENVCYKLNGQAEVFYRKASLKLEKTTIHNKNEALENKNELNAKKYSVFEYDLIKNKRYTVDKFLFHVPITLNFQNDGKKVINYDVNEYLKENDVNVIGIDRGERNLIYITVVDFKGEMLEQISLNEIVNEYNGNLIKTDYHNLLNKREMDNKNAKESWKTVENIKELKEGYLSQVVHKIVELMDKYKAIIVIEDLNKGFKNSRIKFEKQVYQKFEKMLIDKLNYLVFKNRDIYSEGGLLNAYQLTNCFEGFNKLGKQTGILFYIPAWCTSKIDPITGFVNLINFKYESVEKSKNLISKFDDINYNEFEHYLEFYIDYEKLNKEINGRSYGNRRYWTICTYGDRIETKMNSNGWYDSKMISLIDEFTKLFDEYEIDINHIKSEILEINDASFWERFMRLLRLTCQMRNSVPTAFTDEDLQNRGIEINSRDYIISPIKSKSGIFYDSRNVDEKLPKDADANGAYNIARKGLMLVDQIRKTEDSKLNKVKFTVSNEDWLKYVQEKDI